MSDYDPNAASILGDDPNYEPTIEETVRFLNAAFPSDKAPLTTKEAIVIREVLFSDKKRKSRKDAARNKKYLLGRNDGRCEICDLAAFPILVGHHVRPVSALGDGGFTNIIALCPNCHALVHFFRRKYHKRLNSAIGVIAGAFIERVTSRATDVANQNVEFLEGGAYIKFKSEAVGDGNGR